MSWFETTDFDCPRCARSFSGATAETINVTRMPSARDRILDGSFNRLECDHCHAIVAVDRAFLYTDVRREQFVHVFPVNHVADWPKWEEIACRTFEGAFDPAPPAMREVARRYRVRVVFGLAALAEKLRLWDAGFEDAIIELIKLELAAADESLRARGELGLTVLSLDRENGSMEIIPGRGGTDQDERHLVRIARYEELRVEREAMEARFPGLFHRPFVDFRRLARERVDGAGAGRSPA